MIYQRFNIWEGSGCKQQTDANLSVYIPDNSPEIDMNRRYKAVLICPGGGYQGVSDREAEPVALAFLAKGIAAFVLRYSVAPARYPTALLEVSRAMWLIRQRADEWNINADDIAVCGFSAGGHLAASLGTLWNEAFIPEELGMPEGMNKPNKLILCYPVILCEEGRAHRDSFYNLLGRGLPEEEYEKFSLDRRVGRIRRRRFCGTRLTTPGYRSTARSSLRSLCGKTGFRLRCISIRRARTVRRWLTGAVRRRRRSSTTIRISQTGSTIVQNGCWSIKDKIGKAPAMRQGPYFCAFLPL